MKTRHCFSCDRRKMKYITGLCETCHRIAMLSGPLCREEAEMNVKELREALEGLPEDMPVVLQKDGEGNGYSPLSVADGDNNSYKADSTWGGTVKYTKLTDFLKKRGFTDEDVAPEGSVPCLVLVPVN